MSGSRVPWARISVPLLAACLFVSACASRNPLSDATGSTATKTLELHHVHADGGARDASLADSGPSPSPALAAFVLYAERSVKLGKGDRTTGGDLGVVAPAAQGFGPQVVVGELSSVDAQGAVIAPSVQVDHGASLGEVETSALTNDGGHVRIQLPPPSSMPPLPIATAPAPGTQVVSVDRFHVQRLTPGAYGAITVSGTLLLEPGTFVMSSLAIADGGVVLALPGTADVRIAGTVATGTGARLSPLQPEDGWLSGWGPPARCRQHAPASQLSVSVFGSDVSGGPLAAVLGPWSVAEAVLVAPHGTLSLGQGAMATGAFAAFDVLLGDGVAITYESGLAASAAPQKGTQTIGGNVPPAIASAPVVSPLAPTTLVTLGIALPLQLNGASGSGFPPLTTFIDQVSTGASPALTPSSFAAAYGPSASDYAALTSFVAANGLSVLRSYTARDLLAVTGTAAAVENAFFVSLNVYERPDGTTFYAPASDPSLNLGVSILNVAGLDDFSTLRRSDTPQCYESPASYTGTGFFGTDFRNAYFTEADGVTSCLGTYGGTSDHLEGENQTIALIEFDSYLVADITAYAGGTATPMFGVPFVPNSLDVDPGLSNVKQVLWPSSIQHDGTDQLFSPNQFLAAEDAGVAGDDPEPDLDVSMVLAMAPKAKLIVYEANEQLSNYSSGSTPELLLAQVADEDIAQNISLSAAWNPSATGEQVAVWNVFAQYAAQSQSFYVAAGDLGSIVPNSPYVPGVQTPAPNLVVQEPIIDSPFMTVVGGTQLQTTAGGARVQETTWNDTYLARTIGGTVENTVTTGGFCVGSSPNPGGGSPFPALPLPVWQQNVNPSNTELASNTLNARMIPDVSIVADGIFTYCGTGAGGCGGSTEICQAGTSAGAPLWAAFAALVNQARGVGATPSASPIGFVTPTLYTFASKFNDIADHSNNNWFDNGQAKEIGILPVDNGYPLPIATYLPYAQTPYGFETLYNLVDGGAPGGPEAGVSESPGLYHAVTGYDLATGLGTPTCGLLLALAPTYVPPAPPDAGTDAGTDGGTGVTISYHQVGECEGLPDDPTTEAGEGLAFVVFGIDSVTNAEGTPFVLGLEQLFVPLNDYPTILSDLACDEGECDGGYYDFPTPFLADMSSVAAGATLKFTGGSLGTQYIMMEIPAPIPPGSPGATEASFFLSYSSTANLAPTAGGTLAPGVNLVKSNAGATASLQLVGDCSKMTLQ